MKDFKLGNNPIAVVGMSSLMPDAKELNSYWDNIVEKVVSIVDVPSDRWSLDDYYDADPFAEDKTYCKRGAFIPDIEFNPMEYGLPPNILEVTDVSQLLGLVVAKDVLEDSGIFSEEDYNHDRIGITLGIGGGQKLSAALTARLQYPVMDKVLKSAGVPDADRAVLVGKYKKAFVPWEENSFPGLLGNVIAGRIANRFNFGGMNSVVDAACASSLSAMKMAVNELVLGNSDLMITGGSCTDNSIFMYMSFSKTPAFTPNDFIKPFDIDSKGMMVGEGIGMIALKRLEDAERDGDRIYALIKGIGASSDGRFKSIYAPRPEGQAKALNRAYEQAGFEPKTVGLVEAHGTGTAAGDVAEFASLKSVFSQNNEVKQHIALGSVKSQIGHLKAAAGAAGFMKCALALHHKVLPPTASLETPNPKLEVEDSPFYLNAITRPWCSPTDGSPRRAAVSAFGFGGTNFHFVLEEYRAKAEGEYRIKLSPRVSILSAANPAVLLDECKRQLSLLEDEKVLDAYQVFVKNHQAREIAQSDSRVALVSKNESEAKEALILIIKTLEGKQGEVSWDLPQGIYYRENGMEVDGKVVALFSGQGSQYLRMGDALAQSYPEYMDSLEQMDAKFVESGMSRLSDTTFPIAGFNKEEKTAQDKKLQATENAQPSIACFSAGAYKLFQNAGLNPNFIAGHSFGELGALWAAGVYSEGDYYQLAKARGAAMAAPEDPNFDAGSMMAVVGPLNEVEAVIKDLDEVKVANYNSATQVVLAGSSEQLGEVAKILKEKKIKAIPLNVSAAFHTPLVAHAQKPFADAIDTVKFKKPEIPVYANGTGEQHKENAKDIQQQLKDHILGSVKFNTEIENIYKDGGRVFVEFGPKNVLTKLVENILEGKDFHAVAINPSPTKCADTQLKMAAAKLSVLGFSLDEIDPYAKAVRVCNTHKPSPLGIKVSAASYVSDKTRQAFDDALQDGFAITANSSAAQLNPSTSDVDSPQVLGSIERSLGNFYQHQNETLKVHEKYLEGPAQYAETFKSLMAQLNELIERNPGFEIPEAIEKSLVQFNQHQSETIKVHETYLQQQAEVSKASLNLMGEHYSLLTGNPVSTTTSIPTSVVEPAVVPVVEPVSSVQESVPEAVVANSEPQDFSQLQNTMLAIVADKTGYPVDMIELDMDMEADLGIDSIKRVEILGSVQDEFPNLPELNPEDLAALRSLQEIVDHMKTVIEEAGDANNVDISSAEVVVEQGAQGNSAQGSVADLTDLMLRIVAEKTGYPTEMLELDMDMEADLGIDSIKRVEILGAVQDDYPGLPELDPEDLAQLRTLRQVVDYIAEKAPQQMSSVQASETQITSATLDNSSSVGVDAKELTQKMLAVVADKTGYPEDMLELEMDMEADLGIDSIKRVEILGSIQDEYPNLPEFNPEEMAELRTLAQIIDYMESQISEHGMSSENVGSKAETISSVEAKGSARSDLNSSLSIDLETLKQSMLAVVADKTGYPAEMLEMDMDMEADLGIDSIKRVEILGSLQDSYPDLPELDPEALAELRTLGQIVDYISGQLSDLQGLGEETPAPVPESKSESAKPATEKILDTDEIQTTLLKVVSEKTGYPEDMLELEMDMEADLGIDSIKRVEILGAMQELVPDLPEVDPEVLAEQRTLAQIIETMKAQITGVISNGEDSADLPDNVVPISKLPEDSSLAGELLSAANNFVSRGLGVKKLLPEPDKLVSLAPAGRSALVVNDGAGLAAGIVQGLKVDGWKVALIHLPEVDSSEEIEADKTIALSGYDESQLKQAVEDIEADLGRVAQFVYCDSQVKCTKKQTLSFDAKSGEHLKFVFLMAKHLQASLKQAEENSRNAFVCVTYLDGELGLGKGNYSAIAGGYFGLCKTLAQEWPGVLCRGIDLGGKQILDPAEIVLKELKDGNVSLREVAHSNGQRSTQEAKAEELDPQQAELIDENSVFLVSGGAKGVTSSCVIELAKRYQSKFILLGRSELLESEPGWAKGAADDNALKTQAMDTLKEQGDKPTPVKVANLIAPILSSREIQSVLDEIAKAGGHGVYASCDITDAASVKTQVKNLSAELGAVSGIIHGAGVLADKLIESKTGEEFDLVYGTKIAGIGAMLSAVKIKDIKFVAMFSSAAGFFGNVAQSDYSIANDILNKSALLIKQQNPNCRVLSFNWGPWDGGMVTPQLKRMFAERGVSVIPIEGGAKLFADYMSAESVSDIQVLVGGTLEGDGGSEGLESHSQGSQSPAKKSELETSSSVVLERDLVLYQNQFLGDHVVGENPVLPMVCAAAWMTQVALENNVSFKLKALQNLRVLNGLVFEQNEMLCFAELVCDDDTSSDRKVSVLIFSEKDGRRMNHYACDLYLTKSVVSKESFGEFRKQESLYSSDSAHKYYDNGTLFHGKGLQLLEEELLNDKSSLVLKSKVASFSKIAQGQFPIGAFDHFSMDALLQACLVWVREHKGMGSLPLKVNKITFYDQMPIKGHFYINLRVMDSSATKVNSDVVAHDDEGNIYFALEGVEVVMSKNLDDKFAFAAKA